MRWERGVCEPHATMDICLTQWLLLSPSVWRRRKKGRKEGVEEGVRLDGGSGRGGDGGESSLGSRSQQFICEGNASDTMHACSRIVGCQCRQGGMSTPVALFMGLPGSGFAHLSNVRRRLFSQAGTRMMCSHREDPSVLLRYL